MILLTKGIRGRAKPDIQAVMTLLSTSILTGEQCPYSVFTLMSVCSHFLHKIPSSSLGRDVLAARNEAIQAGQHLGLILNAECRANELFHYRRVDMKITQV